MSREPTHTHARPGMPRDAVRAAWPFLALAIAVTGLDALGDRDPMAMHAGMLVLIGLLLGWCCTVALRSRGAIAGRTDPLTGAYNHRHFQERMLALASSCVDAGRPLSLVMLDVDDFGFVNETYSHAEGDRFLREIALVMRRHLRGADMLFRHGGDEFALALPGRTAAEAEQLAHAIARDCAAVRGLASEPSVTAGIATLPTHTGDANELVQLADGTLYWSKLNGKGGVTVYDDAVVKVLSHEQRLEVVEQHARLRAVLALARALDARDAYTARHSQNVARYAVAIAVELGWNAERCELLRVAGLLHDVGKIGVRDSTLRKADRLTAEEWDEMRRHPVLSARVIAGVAPEEIIPWVSGHHERMDGRGYPEGLPGDAIPLGARILTVADSFDAMTSSRSYRAAMAPEEAIQEIVRCSHSQFDPLVVRAFLAAVQHGAMELGVEVALELSVHDVEPAVAAQAVPLEPEFGPGDYEAAA